MDKIGDRVRGLIYFKNLNLKNLNKSQQKGQDLPRSRSKSLSPRHDPMKNWSVGQENVSGLFIWNVTKKSCTPLSCCDYSAG